MKIIPLTKGLFAKIDDGDFEAVSKYKWCALVDSRRGRASAIARVGGKHTLMHRLLLGITDPSIFVDHINHNSLDNRRANLRLATNAQNQFNRRPDRDKRTSRYKGVSSALANCDSRPWRASIRINDKLKFLGYFKTEIEAAEAYNRAAVKHAGQFACVNTIPGRDDAGSPSH